jgi:hypothetical protein
MCGCLLVHIPQLLAVEDLYVGLYRGEQQMVRTGLDDGPESDCGIPKAFLRSGTRPIV